MFFLKFRNSQIKTDMQLRTTAWISRLSKIDRQHGALGLDYVSKVLDSTHTQKFTVFRFGELNFKVFQ